VNEERLVRAPRVILCGMGGSRLAGDLVRSGLPTHDITVHADFGAPPHAGNDTLFVVSSYSGDTEEAFDAFRAVREGREHVAVIAGGGALLKNARAHGIPFIEIPEKNLPPRLAVGYSVRALLSFIGDQGALAKVASATIPESLPEESELLAERLANGVPLIYSSRRMGGLAYYWKVVLNETSKMYAFANVLPEAGHNEIEELEKNAEAPFICLTLTDPEDDGRVEQRLALLSRTCREHDIPAVPLRLSGTSIWERLFRSVALANWTGYRLAKMRGADPSRTPLIDEWKRELRG
jgi:glucose/mannose-6-phosphate isomerase